MIHAIIFDLDNTLTDFMKMKSDAVTAAIDGMIDAGLRLPREAVRARIDAIYQEQGLEYQRVFDLLLESEHSRSHTCARGASETTPRRMPRFASSNSVICTCG